VPFNARGKLVTIREDALQGPLLAQHFRLLDRKAERIDLAGSLVPVYGLNSILDGCPFWGHTGIKKGRSIIGLTYAMKGNLNEPAVSVNPLRFDTGIFRRIFEFDPPKEILLACTSAQASAFRRPRCDDAIITPGFTSSVALLADGELMTPSSVRSSRLP